MEIETEDDSLTADAAKNNSVANECRTLHMAELTWFIKSAPDVAFMLKILLTEDSVKFGSYEWN